MSRVARLALGLRRRTNDTLAAVDVAHTAAAFRLPESFVRRLVAEEIERRGGNVPA
jgi:hypothetical protein